MTGLAESLLRVSHIAWPVSALGPGKRLVLWTAGCPLRCNNCITPQLQPDDSGKLISIEKLVRHILSINSEFDGLTITGGEPFIQAKFLSIMWQELKVVFPHWNLLVFSGFPITHWLQHSDAALLLKHMDILIDGPYDPGKPAIHPLAASANQKIHYLSETGNRLRPEIDSRAANEANFGLSRNSAWLIGIIDPANRKELHQQFGFNPSISS